MDEKPLTLLDEVEAAIKCLKNNRSQGIDNVTSEITKYSGNKLKRKYIVYVTKFGKKKRLQKSGKSQYWYSAQERKYTRVQWNCCSDEPFGKVLIMAVTERLKMLRSHIHQMTRQILRKREVLCSRYVH